VSGVTPVFAEMRNLIPQAGGRFIDPIDTDQQRHVVFLGDELAKNVFGERTDPVGKTALLQGSPFQVVGVLKKKARIRATPAGTRTRCSCPEHASRRHRPRST